MNKCLFCGKELHPHYLYFCPNSDCKTKYKKLKTSERKKNWTPVTTHREYDNCAKWIKPEKEQNENYSIPAPSNKNIYVPFRSHKGHVYLIEAENGMHKIGITRTDIKRRVDQLEREIPLKMKVLHLIRSENCLMVERYLHSIYSEQRIRYEWFRLSDEQILEIKNINGRDIDILLGIVSL